MSACIHPDHIKDIPGISKNLPTASFAELCPPVIKLTTNFEITANLTAEIALMDAVRKQEDYMELPDASAKKAYLIGQMDGNMLNLRLTRAIHSQAPVDIEHLLPDIESKSIHYKQGLKNFVLSKTFPLALKLFYESPRSRKERIAFMNTVLDKLR